MSRRALPALMWVVVSLLSQLIPADPNAGVARPAASPGVPPVMARLDCGTDPHGQGRSARTQERNAMHARRLARQAIGRAPAASPMEFVHDGIYVVEATGDMLIADSLYFDMDTTSLLFTADSDSSYEASFAAFAWDSAYGADLLLQDNDTALVHLPFNFSFYGSTYNQVVVASNGMVLFGDAVYGYRDYDFFNATPKVAPYFMDLDPEAAGAVHARVDSNQVLVSWVGVPEHLQSAPNTFQLVLRSNGDLTFSYNGIGTPAQLNGPPDVNPDPIYVGVHPGGSPEPAADLIDYTAETPYSAGPNTAIYEAFYIMVLPTVYAPAVTQQFYSSHPDVFFQVAIFTNFQTTMYGFANELNIKNDVTGIGLAIFDNSANWGSAGALESRLLMNQLSAFPDDPHERFLWSNSLSFLNVMAHETGHRWGAFVNFEQNGSPSDLILGSGYVHWSYYADTDFGALQGGEWVSQGGNHYLATGLPDHYFDVEEYLMGLRTPEEVTNMFYISSAENDDYYSRIAGVMPGDSASGIKIPVTIEQIIAAEGDRVPLEPDQEKDLRQAFILLVENGTTPTTAELNKIANFRAAWEDYFEVAADGRLTCNTRVDETFPVGTVIGHLTDHTTTQPILPLEARSLERGFTQRLAGGGRYTFRYQAGDTSSTSETATLVFWSKGYYPDTCQVEIAYGDTLYKDVTLVPVVVGVDNSPAHPSPVLHANYPNPFNPTTTIRYQLPSAGDVTLAVYDVTGRLVTVLFNGRRAAGLHTAEWEGVDRRGNPAASGVYFYRLVAGEFTESRKMLLLK